MEPLPALPEPDHLERLVTLIDAAVADRGWYRPHLLVRVEWSGDGAEYDLAMKDLPPRAHPFDELWGFEAPPTWVALGVVTYGWCSPDGGLRPSAHPERQRVRATLVVDRSGTLANTATLEDGTVIDEQCEGALPDVLRRCLGAPTAPPPPMKDLADVLWLMTVAERTTCERMGWTRIEAIRNSVRPGVPWSRVREIAAATGAWPEALTWMDDGMFARELLAGLPPIDLLLDQLDQQLSATAARKVRGALGNRRRRSEEQGRVPREVEESARGDREAREQREHDRRDDRERR